ncbi:hypothetical protein OXPF_33850 [Oxobacter pfennigii]|uniref:Uncharacterized protein n=1 Tax=Oxobacter pfennigii TaxID=36849 RepID=A0A0P8W611_9CLOT|nr:hypothetical protein [Oxobacter pfennigii]KPU43135.1 hypothetical protein OXPF_33850 [Oxobacter pfennigii]
MEEKHIHDHSHDHYHDHDHGHNHDHEHHDHDCTCDCLSLEEETISVSTHEMSVVGSYKIKIDKPYDEAVKILDDCIKEVASEINKISGIIGHIKAYLVSEGDSCMISITDEESSIKHIKGEYANVEGVAIVFNVEPDKLKSILKKALDKLN